MGYSVVSAVGDEGALGRPNIAGSVRAHDGLCAMRLRIQPLEWGYVILSITPAEEQAEGLRYRSAASASSKLLDDAKARAEIVRRFVEALASTAIASNG